MEIKPCYCGNENLKIYCPNCGANHLIDEWNKNYPFAHNPAAEGKAPTDNPKWPKDNECCVCKGEMVFMKSTFEQYQPSVWECAQCKRTATPYQMEALRIAINVCIAAFEEWRRTH